MRGRSIKYRKLRARNVVAPKSPSVSWAEVARLPAATWLTTAVLVGVNLVPIYYVLKGEWDTFMVLLLFWGENMVIGIFNELRLACFYCHDDEDRWAKKNRMLVFLINYFVFTLVHLILLVMLFGRFSDYLWNHETSPNPLEVIKFPLAALAASHAVSFVVNYIGQGEYKTAKLDHVFFAPYDRVIILHFVLLIGGLIATLFGSPIPALVLLVLFKIMMDVWGHLSAHAIYQRLHAI